MEVDQKGEIKRGQKYGRQCKIVIVLILFHNLYSGNVSRSGDFFASENLFQKISENAERLGDFPASRILITVAFALVVCQKLCLRTGKWSVFSVEEVPCVVMPENFICIV